MPRLADGPDPGVLRAGRGALAREPVTGVEAPQAVVAIDPAVRVADDERRPADVAAGPDGDPVAAGVVDERDAQRPAGLVRDVARIGLVEGVAPDPPEEVERSADVALPRERQPHDVFAGLEVRRVRPGARVDDRMALDDLEARVVPAAAQVVALLVVGRGAEPGRLQLPSSRASRTTKHCSRSASWSLAPSNVERQSFIA